MDREILFEMLAYVVITADYKDRIGWGPIANRREHLAEVLAKSAAWIRREALKTAETEGVHRGAALMLGLACALAESDFPKAIGFLESLGVQPAPRRNLGPMEERIPFPNTKGDGLEDLQGK